MKMFSIASGSSGNCTYVGDNNTHILVDAGISTKKIVEGLKNADIDIKDLSAIFVTHEHIDHIKALGVLLRKYNIPIYTSLGTKEGILECKSLGDYDNTLINLIEANKEYIINDLKIYPFNINHDARQTFGYRFASSSKRVAVATDIGSYDEYTIKNLSNLDALLIEANHDVRMLELGTYPYELKRRILGDYGHLSNENSGKLICSILHDNLKHIFLGHLSDENNYPDIALETVKCEIDIAKHKYKSKDFNIEVAKKEGNSSIIEV